jgi:hypothetical protein
MTSGGGRDWGRLGCAALLGASAAFPLGVLVGGGEPSRETAGEARRPGPSGGEAPAARNAYSPRIASDRYVIEQQRRVVQTLEASCRESGRYCPEAEQARLRIEEAEARR